MHFNKSGTYDTCYENLLHYPYSTNPSKQQRHSATVCGRAPHSPTLLRSVFPQIIPTEITVKVKHGEHRSKTI